MCLKKEIFRGAYIIANNETWCPEHFICSNKNCNRKLLEIGFIEEKGEKYCEQCFEKYIAPHCAKCNRSITGVSTICKFRIIVIVTPINSEVHIHPCYIII